MSTSLKEKFLACCQNSQGTSWFQTTHVATQTGAEGRSVIKQTTAWEKQEHSTVTRNVEAKGNGALGVKSPLFHRTLDKTT